jgi:hypothetical protein
MMRKSCPGLRRLGVSSAARLAALALASSLATVSPALAQVPCPQQNGAGMFVQPDQHIFCGEVNALGLATGFHSRPGGLDPNSITIVGGTTITYPAGAPNGIYQLNQFNITQGPATNTKPVSTMFPDACAAADVLAAITNAQTNGAALVGGGFHGPSGASCQAGAPLAPFDIKYYTADGLVTGAITTAYPNF